MGGIGSFPQLYEGGDLAVSCLRVSADKKEIVIENNENRATKLKDRSIK